MATRDGVGSSKYGPIVKTLEYRHSDFDAHSNQSFSILSILYNNLWQKKTLEKLQ
jgi:hypothetical protein